MLAIKQEYINKEDILFVSQFAKHYYFYTPISITTPYYLILEYIRVFFFLNIFDCLWYNFCLIKL